LEVHAVIARHNAGTPPGNTCDPTLMDGKSAVRRGARGTGWRCGGRTLLC